jgi:CRP/FNR family transcriptional regulator
MVNEHKRAVILAQHDARERLALFLLQLSQRYRNRGLSEHEFNLSMSRRDIASFLALTVETVSRMFTHFHSERLIKVDGRRIHLLSLERLRQIVSTDVLSIV